MRKLSAFLIVMLLVLGTVFSVSAQGDTNESGVILGFTDSTITLKVDNQTTTYKISPDAKVIQNDMDAYFGDVAKKGLKIDFKENAGTITYMDIPASGIESIGMIDKLETVKGQLMITIKEVRENTSDSSLLATDKNAAKIGEELDDAFQYNNSKSVNLGDVTIIPGTMKVTVEGKDLKVLENGAAFSSSVVGDEVKLVLNKTFYSLEFEKPFPADVLDAEQLSKLLSISFKKAMYNVTTTELNTYPVNEDVLAELNGNQVSISKVQQRAGEAEVRTNLDGEIVYIGGYYKNFVAKVAEVKDNVISLYIEKSGKKVFTDKIQIADVATITDCNGVVIEAMDLFKGAYVLLTVDPYDGYKAIFISRLYY